MSWPATAKNDYVCNIVQNKWAAIIVKICACAIIPLYCYACFTFSTMNRIKYYNLFIAAFCNSDFICTSFNISFVLTVLFSMKMVSIGFI